MIVFKDSKIKSLISLTEIFFKALAIFRIYFVILGKQKNEEKEDLQRGNNSIKNEDNKQFIAILYT